MTEKKPPKSATEKAANRYTAIIERIFLDRYRKGEHQVPFVREDIERTATELGINLPKNLGDVVYSFRHRNVLPEAITKTAPEGTGWIIMPRGRSGKETRYCFELREEVAIKPNPMLAETKIPNSTPGVIARYALTDEQALLAVLRYNRLVDIFTGVTCYSLQSHLRTYVQGIGQIETDEVYVGVDRRGAHYVFPVQAKGGSDVLGIVQIEQDFALCDEKFPELICRPIGAQFLEPDLIALMAFERGDRIAISYERHYRLVAPDELSDEDLAGYRERPAES